MILHISHNDLDGIACGILVKACIPSVQTIYTNYDELDTVLENISPEVSTVIITDLGPSEALVERIAGEKEFLLIDHHISTLPLVKYPFVVHSIEKSATLLTYEYFTSKGYDLSRYEDFVICVDDFDLWKLKRNDSLRMNMLLTLLGTAKFEKRFFNEPYNGFKPEEDLLITLEEERRNTYISRAAKTLEIFTDREQRKFAVLFAELYASELGNYVLSETAVDFVMIINAQRKKVSLRSNNAVDVSKIAMRNGGGGHKNAAGFNLEADFNLHEILENLELIR